ncbi:MAG TPA: glycosyltransferase family 4 protein [Thermodesulfobacteriota bacterium]|nr:glycosyltransferase family 4 protein [Thermodesulfobacteriota bacterium]
MRILLQNQYAGSLAGTESYFMLLIGDLRAMGHEVVCVYTMSGIKADHGITKDGVTNYYLPYMEAAVHNFWTDRAALREVKRDVKILMDIVDRHKIDIVHLNNTRYPFLYAALKEKVPLVQTLHDYFHVCPTLLKLLGREGRPICTHKMGLPCLKEKCISLRKPASLATLAMGMRNRTAIKRFDLIFVTTSHMKDTMVRNGFKADKVIVNPLYVKVEKDSFSVADNETKPLILYVGRVAEEKGLDDFLLALKHLDCDFQAQIIGTGPVLGHIRSTALRYGLGEKVTFSGFLEYKKIIDFYKKATVVVVPSIWPEPFGMVGIEAMSLMRPIIAYDVGGISTWLKHGENGYLVAKNNISMLTQRINELLCNRKLAKKMGEKGNRLFKADFNCNRHMSALISTYEDISNRRNSNLL